jgi:hypothetical protein
VSIGVKVESCIGFTNDENGKESLFDSCEEGVEVVLAGVVGTDVVLAGIVGTDIVLVRKGRTDVVLAGEERIDVVFAVVLTGEGTGEGSRYCFNWKRKSKCCFDWIRN